MEERSGLHGITLLIDTHTQIYTRTSAIIRKMAKEVETWAQIGVNQRKVAQVCVCVCMCVCKCACVCVCVCVLCVFVCVNAGVIKCVIECVMWSNLGGWHAVRCCQFIPLAWVERFQGRMFWILKRWRNTANWRHTATYFVSIQSMVAVNNTATYFVSLQSMVAVNIYF